MSNEFIAVLDLGSTKVACLAAREDPAGFHVVAVASEDCKGVRRGVVADVEQTSNAISACIRRVEQAAGVDIKSVVVGVGGTHIQGISTRGFVPLYPKSRTITRDDILQVMNHSRQVSVPANREQIQVLPREFWIDGQDGVAKPIGLNGSKLEVTTYLVTGEKTHVHDIEKALALVGKRVEMMVVKSLASGLGVLTPQEMEAGAVVIDIGGSTTEVAVFSKGSLVHTACIPIGGQHVSADISKLLKSSPDEAERLKLESASAISSGVGTEESVDVLQLGQTHSRPMQRRVLCEIVESRMREVASEARQQIERSKLFGNLPAGAVLTGGGSKLAGTENLFDSVLQHLKVRSGSPHAAGERGSDTDRPEMAVAVGLARFALECSDDELATASGNSNWKERIRTFWSLTQGKA